MSRCAFCLLLASGAAALPAQAQDSLPPWEGGLTASLGQPSRTYFYGTGTLGLDWRGEHNPAPSLYAGIGVTRSLGNPVEGLLAASGEMYGGVRSARVDGGVRALVQVPSLRLTVGADYNARDNRFAALLGVTLALRRGGVFGGGSVLRAEWSSPPLDALRATVVIPVRQPAAGRTRPHRDRVDVPVRGSHAIPPPLDAPGLEEALAGVRTAAERMQHLIVPYLDRRGSDPRVALAPLIAELLSPPPIDGINGPGLQVDRVVAAYHSALVRAFSIAASAAPLPPGSTTPEGETAAARARAALLEHVLYPYDHLLGQWKTRTSLAGFGTHARGGFARDVVSMTTLAPERETALLYVFQQLLETVQRLEREELRLWGDSRTIWLPLQLGLRPEDHDTQQELDAILEAVMAVRFTDGNRVWYVINDQFQNEVIRSIQRAEDYHVLWIHDFSGRNDLGQPDAQSLRYVVDAYFAALVRRVREYDVRRRIPIYMVFLDQHYYERNRGRLWLDLLERPLGRVPRLPPGSEALEKTIRIHQVELRDAIAASHLLQAEARQYGGEWLRNLIMVHVSVTYPADPSFWSHQMIPVLGVPDNIMRDHRKIVFYDVSEDDPYRGLALYTGMGIGEHYVGPAWEDRSIMVQGPAILSLKAQARKLLESQGISGDRVPYPLRPRPLAPGYDAAVAAEIAGRRAAGGRDQRAVELHNGTGFQEKQVSVAKAALYSLMPPGSVVKVPDSLWGNALFAALLTGSAFRGCRVLFVAPSLASAPSSGWPSMGVAHDLFARLIVLQQELGPELELSGGMLKTGIYNPGIGVQDVAGRFSAAYRNARRTPFLRRLFPVHSSVDTLLAHASSLLPAAESPTPGLRAHPVMPKLHLKANFFASREAWDSLLARPELAAVLQAYLSQLLRTDPRESDVRQSAATLGEAGDRLVRDFQASLPPEQRERVIYYLLVGSANEDYRSMLMDGEASVLLSGWSGVVGLIDFSLIVNLSVWIDDLDMLDALLPPASQFQRGVARRIRPAL
jgi:hypothetical protein